MKYIITVLNLTHLYNNQFPDPAQCRCIFIIRKEKWVRRCRVKVYQKFPLDARNMEQEQDRHMSTGARSIYLPYIFYPGG